MFVSNLVVEWIQDFLFNNVDEYPWTPEEIIAWTMICYIVFRDHIEK